MGPEQTAVIAGASSEIGGAIALAIASTGAAVCLIGRNRTRLEAVAIKARSNAREVLVCPVDLELDSAVENLAEGFRRKFEVLDVLVHCAGAYLTGKIASSCIQDLDALYNANIRSPFVLTRAFLPFLSRRYGQIVFINSSQGLTARANTGLFALSQHAMRAFADSLRQEVNAEGIRVLSVYPGRTATARMKALYKAEGRKYQPALLLQAEDIAQMLIAALQLPRTAEVTNLEIRPLIKSY
jgi:NADP-dependent 3-hydroxy acid dehydrogenase YdfG